MRHRRKRSAAITLVLASVAGCSEPEPQRDVYTSLESCQRDWPDGNACQRATGSGHPSSWYYGPGYYGSSYGSGRPKPSPNAADAFRAPGAPVARGGFGASARAFSGSGS